MMEQAGESSNYGFGYAANLPPPPPAPPRPSFRYELRPLSVGEVLDRTLSLYRQRFWLYCGLAAGAAAFQTLTSLLQLFFFSTPGKMASAQDAITSLLGAGVALLASLVYFAAYSVTQAATVSAVLASYLGHETSATKALKAVGANWLRFVGIVFWQIWSLMWPLLLLIPIGVLGAMRVLSPVIVGFLVIVGAIGCLVFGLIAYIRNSLAIAASMMERLKVRASMRRSKTLAAGNKWRIFMLLLLLGALSMVAGMLQAPIILTLGLHPSGRHFAAKSLSMLIAFISSSLVGPVGAIGFCLFYIDARVRKEGFDIEALMDPTLGSGVPNPPAAPIELLPSGFAPSGFTAPPPPASPFASTGFTAPASPFPPSPFTASPPPVVNPKESPFGPSEFTDPAKPDESHG